MVNFGDPTDAELCSQPSLKERTDERVGARGLATARRASSKQAMAFR
jgi:hypothetical protein